MSRQTFNSFEEIIKWMRAGAKKSEYVTNDPAYALPPNPDLMQAADFLEAYLAEMKNMHIKESDLAEAEIEGLRGALEAVVGAENVEAVLRARKKAAPPRTQ